MNDIISRIKKLLPFSLLGILFLLYSQQIHAQGVSFSFGAAGDFANGSNFTATVNQVKAANPAFMLAVGDLAYTTAEQSWCNTWKSNGVNNILIVAGNHDSGESSSGNINTYVQYCPYTLSSPMTGTYGKEYYFDYPQTNPLARIIMVSPGLGGSFMGIDTNYSIGHTGYTFVSNAIDSARNAGIKWIIVGEHKNYISTMEKSNELGPDFMNMLFAKKVDLVLQGHEHGYERSKQLTCAKLNSYDATCVANSGNSLNKGAGTVIHVVGTGGQSLRSLNTGDSEYQYFAVANNNTYGFGKFTVSASALTFQFVRSAGGTLTDQYSITDNGVVLPTQTPIPAATATPRPTVAATATPIPSQRPTVTTVPTNTPISSNCNVNTTGLSSVTLTSGQVTAGTYTIWSRIMSGGSTANSFYLQIDSGCPIIVGDSNTIPTNSWVWVNYKDGNPSSPISMALTSGVHILKIYGKEIGTKIDTIVLTTDPQCIPTGLGTNCSGVTLKIGDANGDGSVNGLDYVIWFSHYNQTIAGGMSVGDFNTDGKVNGQDFVLWLSNYGS